MIKISLKDNSGTSLPWRTVATPNFPVPAGSPERIAIEQFSGKRLVDLETTVVNRDSFLMYPRRDADIKKSDSIYTLTHDGELGFKTGNLMGFMGLGADVQLRIFSRFDSPLELSNGAKCYRNFFLRYMLQKVSDVVLTPQVSSSDEEFHDLLYYMFPSYLNMALAQGVYRSYESFRYNDVRVRGPIDFNRHLRLNIPFNGRVAYNAREYVTENPVMQLLRHTIEQIRSLSDGEAVLNGGYTAETRNNVRMVEHLTPSYSKRMKMQVIAQNARPITHPYYTAYEPLRKLCIAILAGKQMDFDGTTNSFAKGILFDGAALWEEYLNLILAKGVPGRADGYGNRLLHPNNRTHHGAQHVFVDENDFEERKVYPDFLLDPSSTTGTIYTAGSILDAKYRRLDDGIIDRDTVNQMLGYMLRFKSRRSVLIYPSQSQNAMPRVKTLIQNYANGEPPITLTVLPFRVPVYDRTTSFIQFCRRMEDSEVELMRAIG